ncbi:MAG: hypothetical protein ACOYVD_13230 [Bacillota bacterium]
MRSILSNFPTEKVKLLKKNGEIYEGIEALIDSEKIFIDDATVPIEEEDIIERMLPTGSKEQFIVIDRGFYKGMHGIPDHYQIEVEKVSRYHKPARGSITQTYNIRNESGKININSTDNSVNFTLSENDEQLFETLKQLAASLENSDEIVSKIEEMRTTAGKPTFGQKYTAFIQSIANHMTIFAPFIPTLTTFLAK